MDSTATSGTLNRADSTDTPKPLSASLIENAIGARVIQDGVMPVDPIEGVFVGCPVCGASPGAVMRRARVPC